MTKISYQNLFFIQIYELHKDDCCALLSERYSDIFFYNLGRMEYW